MPTERCLECSTLCRSYSMKLSLSVFSFCVSAVYCRITTVGAWYSKSRATWAIFFTTSRRDQALEIVVFFKGRSSPFMTLLQISETIEFTQTPFLFHVVMKMMLMLLTMMKVTTVESVLCTLIIMIIVLIIFDIVHIIWKYMYMYLYIYICIYIYKCVCEHIYIHLCAHIVLLSSGLPRSGHGIRMWDPHWDLDSHRRWGHGKFQ